MIHTQMKTESYSKIVYVVVCVSCFLFLLHLLEYVRVSEIDEENYGVRTRFNRKKRGVGLSFLTRVAYIFFAHVIVVVIAVIRAIHMLVDFRFLVPMAYSSGLSLITSVVYYYLHDVLIIRHC
jgi:hypothetical protein